MQVRPSVHQSFNHSFSQPASQLVSQSVSHANQSSTSFCAYAAKTRCSGFKKMPHVRTEESSKEKMCKRRLHHNAFEQSLKGTAGLQVTQRNTLQTTTSHTACKSLATKSQRQFIPCPRSLREIRKKQGAHARARAEVSTYIVGAKKHQAGLDITTLPPPDVHALTSAPLSHKTTKIRWATEYLRSRVRIQLLAISFDATEEGIGLRECKEHLRSKNAEDKTRQQQLHTSKPDVCSTMVTNRIETQVGQLRPKLLEEPSDVLTSLS